MHDNQDRRVRTPKHPASVFMSIQLSPDRRLTPTQRTDPFGVMYTTTVEQPLPRAPRNNRVKELSIRAPPRLG
ncbi:hypothetical protein M011DRAFT_466148 [Sporormia fimetaria CBS 119925]|uniref:Uncharacterized protein n=1 Tax=Sporormia fimetaria CBS 119925 TaxID=1340428 RepID=A0A6A6VHH3_9PLEO|nr:hypothetical protein M011DRAFT_466148 [Sporormia fimetaria CBS 119925]